MNPVKCPQCKQVLADEDITDDQTLRCSWCGHLEFLGEVPEKGHKTERSGTFGDLLQGFAYIILWFGFVEPFRIFRDQIPIYLIVMVSATIVFYRWALTWSKKWEKQQRKGHTLQSNFMLFLAKVFANPVFLIPFLAYIGSLALLGLSVYPTLLLMGLGYWIQGMFVVKDHLHRFFPCI